MCVSTKDSNTGKYYKIVSLLIRSGENMKCITLKIITNISTSQHKITKKILHIQKVLPIKRHILYIFNQTNLWNVVLVVYPHKHFKENVLSPQKTEPFVVQIEHMPGLSSPLSLLTSPISHNLKREYNLRTNIMKSNIEESKLVQFCPVGVKFSDGHDRRLDFCLDFPQFSGKN